MATTKTTEKKKEVLPLPEGFNKAQTPNFAGTPFNTKDTRTSTGVVPPATTSPKAATSQSPILRDETTGKKTGFIFPDGTSKVGLTPKEIDFLERKYYGTSSPLSDKNISENPNIPKSTLGTDISSQIGQLNPEQQLLAGGSTEAPGKVNLIDVLKRAGEKGLLSGSSAAVGATGIALGVTAATGGAAAPSIPAVAGLSAAGGFTYGAIKEVFNSYNTKNEFNYKHVSSNIDMAQANMQKAIALAGSGAGDDAKLLAMEEYNSAIAQLALSERQLKELSRNTNSYVGDTKQKLTELEYFNREVRPIMDINFRTALAR